MSLLGIVGAALGIYKIVPIDEAHVRIMGNHKEVFMSGMYKGKECKSSYWRIPGITKVTRLPLSNIRIDVPDTKLNDSDMAKFMCDLVCFVHIIDPILAAERTGLTAEKIRYEGGFKQISEDFKAIMESVGRTTATKQKILDIYKDRSKLDEAVTKEVQNIFPNWGLELVDLEIKDLKDAQGSTIISDIEKKSAAQISADARVKTAEENKRASIAESEAEKETELKTAENEEKWKKRQIQKEQEIAIAIQEKFLKEAEQKAKVNEQLVEANRKLEIGNAEVAKDRQKIDSEALKIEVELEAEASRIRTEKAAEAEAKRVLLTAKADAEKTKITGEAEGLSIKARKLAEAEGVEKLAEAQKKYNDSALKLEQIKADMNVQIEYAKAQSKAFERADVKIIAGSTQEIFGGGILGQLKVGPKEGAALQQMIAENPEIAQKILGLLTPKTKKDIKE